MTTPSSPPEQVSQLLAAWSGGDRGALDELIAIVQPELRRLARRHLRRERPGHTLQTTALVNEVYLKLVDQSHPGWHGRAHFFAVAAQLMRRIMVDHARERHAKKRGGGALKVELEETVLVSEGRTSELLALDEALERLAVFDPRKCQVVEMRYFGGLTIEDRGRPENPPQHRGTRLERGQGLALRRAHPAKRPMTATGSSCRGATPAARPRAWPSCCGGPGWD
jgi:RNA polymerase sigma factor (TIGR02999 family)